jgi:hypothetical protein
LIGKPYEFHLVFLSKNDCFYLTLFSHICTIVFAISGMQLLCP